MSRLPALGLLLAAATTASAQTSSPFTSTVTAEATETVRVKPDVAKVVVSAVVRNADAATASDEAAELGKRFADGLAGLKAKGAKATLDPVKVAKVVDERVVLRGGPAVQPEMQATQTVVVTLADPDPKALVEAVERVQKEAIKEGLSGAGPDGAVLSTRYSTDAVRVSYHKQDGFDDLLAAALGKATKKATTRAEAIATGLGMKLGAVVSAEELPGGGDPLATLSPTVTTRTLTTLAPSGGELVEGELVRTVRVRVIYAVSK